MENNTSLLVTLMIVLAALNLIGWAMLPEAIDEQKISQDITAQVNAEIAKIPLGPTAAEVAALVPKVEVPEWEAPVIPEFKGENMVEDLWEDLYDTEIEELEAEAYDVAVIELEDHNYELLTEWLEANVEGFDELEDADVEDYEINIIELGLEDDEDKIAEVVFELEVEYTLLEGVVQDYKKQILVTATVNFDEGNYTDEDVELVFA